MPNDPIYGGRQIGDGRRRPGLEPRLVARAILAGADEHGGSEPCLECTGDVGLGVVSDHHGALRWAVHARKRSLEERGRRFAQDKRLAPGCKLERGDEGPGIKAEHPVVVLEGPVLGERDEVGAANQLAEGAIEPREVEILARIADHDGELPAASLALELSLQIGMNQKRGRAIMRYQPLPCGLCRREQFGLGNIKPERGKARKTPRFGMRVVLVTKRNETSA